MTMQVQIPDELAKLLQEKAAAAGSLPEELALAAIRLQIAANAERDQILAPVREAFTASGMTEDEAIELFEEEKHAMRREHREPTP